MGCDIHSAVEIQWGGDTDPNARWEMIEAAVFKAPYFREDSAVSIFNVPYSKEPFRARNYDLFALLADVRNSDGLAPFAEPRGIPEDASKGWKRTVKYWGVDMHSHSWIYLSELQDLRSQVEDTVVHRAGYVSPKMYAAYVDNQVLPDMWWRWGTGPNYSVSEYERLNRPSDARGILLTWDDKLHTSVADDIDAALAPFSDAHWQKMADRNLIRIVFGFDN